MSGPREASLRVGVVFTLWALLAPCAAPQNGGGDGEQSTYANITGAKIETLTNAVRITLTADGKLMAGLDWDVWGKLFYVDKTGRWRLDPLDEIPVQLTNAKTQIGTYVDISSYPASHLLFSPLGRGNLGIGLRCSLVLYKPSGIEQLFEDVGWDRGYWVERGVPITTQVRLAQDQRSVIITVMSDEYSDPTHKVRRHTPTGPARLAVAQNGDLLTLDAVSAPLSQVLRELGARSGCPIGTTLVDERWVTCYLPLMPVSEIVEALCAGYELTWTRIGDRGYAVAQSRASDPASYAAGYTERIVLRYLTAKQAINLLPFSLLPYVHLDLDSNGLVVNGPRCLIDKIRADVSVLDVPAPIIEVEAWVVSTQEGATRTVTGAWAGSTETGTLGIGAGRVEVAVSPGATDGPVLIPRKTPPGGWQEALTALLGEDTVRFVAHPRVRVVNGQPGRLFVGETRYITIAPGHRTWRQGGLMPIELGVDLGVTPVTGGGGEIICTTDVSVSNFATPVQVPLPTSVARRVSGTLRIRSGDSILVGGLATRNDSYLVQSLPGARRVEALTDLLGLDSHSRTSEEIFFIIGARVLEPGAKPDNSESVLLLGGDRRDHESAHAAAPAAGDLRSVSTRGGVG